MASRLLLQSILENILGSDHVYFQPPATITMIYPCIVYERSDIDTKFASNNPYSLKNGYTVTMIDRNPDSLIPNRIAMLESCIFRTHYTKDNLNHDVFILYF